MAEAAMRRRSTADEDLVRIYLDEVGRYDLLTKDDEVRLGTAVQTGLAAAERLESEPNLPASERRRLQRKVRAGERAATDFSNANLRLVVSIAKRYQRSDLPLLDLIQEGNIGLMTAVRKFDAEKGFKFSTYATWWIKQSISRGIATSARTIRLPVHAEDMLRLYDRTYAQLTSELNDAPTVQQCAAAMGVPVDKLETVLGSAQVTASIDQTVGDDDSSTFGDLAAVANDEPDVEGLESLLRETIRQGLRCLDDRERRVLELRHGLDDVCGGVPWSLDAVATEFKLTRERIRQIEGKAMSKLRHPAAVVRFPSLV